MSSGQWLKRRDSCTKSVSDKASKLIFLFDLQVPEKEHGRQSEADRHECVVECYKLVSQHVALQIRFGS